MPTGIYKRKSRSDEYRHNIALARLGKKLSEETRKKISEAHKGKKRPPLTEEHKEKVRLNHWSKSIKAEEIKRKIGNKHLGRKRSEEVRKRMSEAAKKNPRRYWLGKKHPQTEESKKKISLALIKNGHHPPIQVGKNNWNWNDGISATLSISIYFCQVLLEDDVHSLLRLSLFSFLILLFVDVSFPTNIFLDSF